MTNNEAIGNFMHAIRWNDMPKKEALEMAIKALEQEPCEDCISRQTACDAIRKYKSLVSVPDEYDIAFDDGIDTAIAEIGHNVPSVIPQPKMGRWMPIEYDGYADGYPVWDKWECSECGWEHNGDKESLTAFCPNCGAKMQEEKE